MNSGHGLPPAGGDQHRGEQLTILQSVFLFVATVLILLRLYVRTRVVPSLGLDDVFILLALIIALIVFALSIMSIQNGLGRHSYYLTKEEMLASSKYGQIIRIIVPLGTFFSRLSIALYMLRVFVNAPRWRWSVRFFVAFLTINNLGLFISAWFICIPFQGLWDHTSPSNCWSYELANAHDTYQGVLSIVCDFVCAILPVAFLWDIQINIWRKVGIMTLLGLGVVTGVCAIVRSVINVRNGRTPYADPSWIILDLSTWAALEELLLLIVATIPAIQPIFKKRRHLPSYNPDCDRSIGTRGKHSRDQYPLDDEEVDLMRARTFSGPRPPHTSFVSVSMKAHDQSDTIGISQPVTPNYIGQT